MNKNYCFLYIQLVSFMYIFCIVLDIILPSLHSFPLLQQNGGGAGGGPRPPCSPRGDHHVHVCPQGLPVRWRPPAVRHVPPTSRPRLRHPASRRRIPIGGGSLSPRFSKRGGNDSRVSVARRGGRYLAEFVARRRFIGGDPPGFI